MNFGLASDECGIFDDLDMDDDGGCAVDVKGGDADMH